MGLSVDVTTDTFAAAVVDPSFERPVLIDFYAQWCGPCQLLKPILEQLAQEYDFVLAKVDIDQNPELASAYQVEGVPDVRVAQQGQVEKGFVGVLSEPQLRDFLNRLQLKSSLEQGLEQLQQAQKTGDWPAATALLQTLQQHFSAHPQVQLAAARHYLMQDQLEQAEQALASCDSRDREYGERLEGLRGLLGLKQAIAAGDTGAELDSLYLAACQAVMAEAFESALEQFLQVVERSRSYRDDGARKAMITVFKVLGDDHPLTAAYRKRLMQALY